MVKRNSSTSIEYTTTAPATMPTRIAAAGFINDAPALLATNPAIHPLAVNDASGRPNRKRVTINAARPEPAADSVVLTATNTTTESALWLNKIAPAEFNPSHPTHANMHPASTSTILWAGIAPDP